MGTKISALPAAGTLDGTEKVPMVQNGVTVEGSTQAIGDLAPKPLGAARTALIVNDAAAASEWGYPSNLFNKSVVTGNITGPAAGIAAYHATYSTDHFYGAKSHVQAGSVTVAGSTPGGVYVYWSGGYTRVGSGSVSISGNCDLAVADGGNIEIIAGTATAAGAGTPYRVSGGIVELQAGSSVVAAGTGTGGRLRVRPSIDGDGGPLTLQAGSSSSAKGGSSLSLNGGTGVGGDASITGGAGGAAQGGTVVLIAGNGTPKGGITLQAATGVHTLDVGGDGSLTMKCDPGTSVTLTDGNNNALIEITDTSKIGFYSHSPVAQQTGVAVTAAAIHAALVNLGLITA